jgi:S-adenosylmethionine/arginine decarboxylase-like enzyme
MTRVDVLAYGTHLVYDGSRADPSRLADRGLLTQVVARLAELLGADGGVKPVVVEDSDGISAGIALPESSVSLHAFPGLGTLCLDVFSVRRRTADAFYRPVEQAFAVGRSTSRRASRARAPGPADSHGLARRLRGERAYAEARFTDLRAFGGE